MFTSLSTMTLVLAAGVAWPATIGITGTAHAGGFEEFSLTGAGFQFHTDQGQTSYFPIVCLVGTPCDVGHTVTVSRFSGEGSANATYLGQTFTDPFLTGALQWTQLQPVIVTSAEAAGSVLQLQIPILVTGQVTALDAQFEPVQFWQFHGLGTLNLLSIFPGQQSPFTADATFLGLLEAQTASAVPEPASVALLLAGGLLLVRRARRAPPGTADVLERT